jgi:hypothetical protein
MPETVVHALELVQIDEENKPASGILGAQQTVQFMLKPPPVTQAGETVAARKLAQSALPPPPLGDVLECNEDADHTVVRTEDRDHLYGVVAVCGRNLEPGALPLDRRSERRVEDCPYFSRQCVPQPATGEGGRLEPCSREARPSGEFDTQRAIEDHHRGIRKVVQREPVET